MSLNRDLFNRARAVIPGGVNSPVRAFNAVGGNPPFIVKGAGPYIYDAEGTAYIDYIGSWGPMILGHAHPDVCAALHKQIENGLSFGAPTALEVTLAEKIIQLMPSIEQIRMVNSGTEATMSAIRLARGFTKRDKIIKFEGCYHGHSDALLVKAGSGALTFSTPSSLGVPHSFTEHTLIAQFNDIDSVSTLCEQFSQDIACIIIEPVAGNMNLIAPTANFLQQLRTLCDQHNIVLIFDEVMTGFRVALGGAQSIYNVQPDLSTLGKIIGGGMPVGAFGGRADIMAHLAPEGPVYQAGTLSGNPMAMCAGLSTLTYLSETPDVYTQLNQRTTLLLNGLQEMACQHNIPFTTAHMGSMFGLFFTKGDTPTCYQDVCACNSEHFTQFFHAMLKQGIYLAPSSFEAGFLSFAHTKEVIEQTIRAASHAFKQISSSF